MFDFQSYIRVLLSVCSGLITLVGSVGIFVSLTVQRRIERLQDTLEEFMDLSYHNTANLTGTMFRLIEKYQMHYQLPDSPSRKILHYIDLTIIIVIFAWLSVLVIDFRPPWSWQSVLYFIPVGTGLGILFFYRYLLKNAINPISNSLFTPLIPPPARLRSVSFLSKYVNVSVKTILKHARLRLVIKKKKDKTLVVLKEELSFDDYFYYVELVEEGRVLFVGFGEIKLYFPNEPVTGKPVPAVKNINIPLGSIPPDIITAEELKAKLFVFPKGEKHPIEYEFNLSKQAETAIMIDDPEISVNYLITYHIVGNGFELLENNSENEMFGLAARHFRLDGKRHCWPMPRVTHMEEVELCDVAAYID